MKHLTEAMANVLGALRALPKGYRHHNRAGGPIKAKHVEAYDGRTLNALLARGLIRWGEYGLTVEGKE